MHFLEDIYLDQDKSQARPKCSCSWVGKWNESEDSAYDQWEQHRVESLFPEEEFNLIGGSA